MIQALADHHRTLAVAESFTGGRLLDALTEVPGASRVLRGGLVAYSNDAKRSLLGVTERDLVVHGSVSLKVAEAMAEGVRGRFVADFGVATTGIAGPTGDTAAKPIGLSWVAVVGPTGRRRSDRIHPGSRTDVKAAAAHQALDLLAQALAAERIL